MGALVCERASVDVSKAKVDGLAECGATRLLLQHQIVRLPVAVCQPGIMQLNQCLCTNHRLIQVLCLGIEVIPCKHTTQNP